MNGYRLFPTLLLVLVVSGYWWRSTIDPTIKQLDLLVMVGLILLFSFVCIVCFGIAATTNSKDQRVDMRLTGFFLVLCVVGLSYFGLEFMARELVTVMFFAVAASFLVWWTASGVPAWKLLPRRR